MPCPEEASTTFDRTTAASEPSTIPTARSLSPNRFREISFPGATPDSWIAASAFSVGITPVTKLFPAPAVNSTPKSNPLSVPLVIVTSSKPGVEHTGAETDTIERVPSEIDRDAVRAHDQPVLEALVQVVGHHDAARHDLPTLHHHRLGERRNRTDHHRTAEGEAECPSDG